MRKTFGITSLVCVLSLLLFTLSFTTVLAQDDNSVAADVVKITLLHLNDVYEITPVSKAPPQGGLARVATLRKRLLKENPNTITILAGDLFSPSALGTAVVANP